MSSTNSIQLLVDKIRAGDDEAVNVIWEEYFPRIVRLAAKRLQGQRTAPANDEDVGLSVMKSVVMALRKGRMPDLNSRDGLWRLLATMTRRKVIDLVRYNNVRPISGESVLHSPAGDSSDQQGMAIVAGDDMPPDMAVEIDAECQRLLNILPRDDLRETALMRLQGYTVREISELRPCHIATIERRLNLIRKYWKRALDEGPRE